MNWSAIGAIALGLAVMTESSARTRFEESSMTISWACIEGRGLPLPPRHRPARRPSAGNRRHVGEAGSSRVCWLLAAGILIFSGSLYTLAVTGILADGAITPFGGLPSSERGYRLAWELLRNTPGDGGEHNFSVQSANSFADGERARLFTTSFGSGRTRALL